MPRGVYITNSLSGGLGRKHPAVPAMSLSKRETAHTAISTTEWSHSTASGSEKDNTLSSACSPQTPTGERTDGSGINDSQSHSLVSAVFEQLLMKQSNTEDDLALDDIATWVEEMQLAPTKHRKQYIVQIVSEIDGIFTPETTQGQRKCPAHRSQERVGRKARGGMAPTIREQLTNHRKGPTKSKASQPSERESESSYLRSFQRLLPIHPHGKMLGCPFVKRNPTRYEWVGNSCTERFGFPNAGKLVYVKLL